MKISEETKAHIMKIKEAAIIKKIKNMIEGECLERMVVEIMRKEEEALNIGKIKELNEKNTSPMAAGSTSRTKHALIVYCDKEEYGDYTFPCLNHFFDPSWSNGFMLAAVSKLDRDLEASLCDLRALHKIKSMCFGLRFWEKYYMMLTVLVLREMEMGDVILGVVLFLDLMHFECGGTEYFYGAGIQQCRARTTQYMTPLRVINLGVTHVPKDVLQIYEGTGGSLSLKLLKKFKEQSRTTTNLEACKLLARSASEANGMPTRFLRKIERHYIVLSDSDMICSLIHGLKMVV
nr:hypothetical protein [Tanacetum cinerariifolium]